MGKGTVLVQPGRQLSTTQPFAYHHTTPWDSGETQNKGKSSQVKIKTVYQDQKKEDKGSLIGLERKGKYSNNDDDHDDADSNYNNKRKYKASSAQ